MGKIRVKALGDEALEKQQKKELQKKKEEKIIAKKAEASLEEKTETPLEEPQKEGKSKKQKVKKIEARKRSKRYMEAKMMVDRSKTYSLSEALEILPKIGKNKFDETVEIHVNTIEKGISGNITLPHGTGKKTRVAIANDQIIADVEKGKIDFDVLLAAPEMMPKLARVARYLGPRGLMPNPKNGTITKNPEETAKKFEAGQINFKTEAKAPIIHMTVGKVSFGKEKLSENIKTALKAIQAERTRNVVLKSTMSLGIKISL